MNGSYGGFLSMNTGYSYPKALGGEVFWNINFEVTFSVIFFFSLFFTRINLPVAFTFSVVTFKPISSK